MKRLLCLIFNNVITWFYYRITGNIPTYIAATIEKYKKRTSGKNAWKPNTDKRDGNSETGARCLNLKGVSK
jgi:hypothetical protein